mmetsp:Transcript_23976/g.58222  ORF Transcript_23976/g.58222 Transcript_23976/m.58222 type:complete len:427 (-) Transcript_23976:1493-2773(-)
MASLPLLSRAFACASALCTMPVMLLLMSASPASILPVSVALFDPMILLMSASAALSTTFWCATSARRAATRSSSCIWLRWNFVRSASMSSSCVLSSSSWSSLSFAIRLSTALPCDTTMPRVAAALWCSSATSPEMLRLTAASSTARRVLSLSLAAATSSLMCPSSSLVSFSRCASMAALAAVRLAPVSSSSLRISSVRLCAASRSALDSALRCTICLACLSSSAFWAALASARLLVVSAWAASALDWTWLIFMFMASMPSDSFFSRSAFWYFILSLECCASVAILLRSLRSRRLSCCSCASLSCLRAASRRWLVSSRFFSSAASSRFVAFFCAFASLSRSEMLLDTPSLVLSCIVLNSLSSSSIPCLLRLKSATMAESRASAADMSVLSLSVSVSFCSLVASSSFPSVLDVSSFILLVSIATSASL